MSLREEMWKYEQITGESAEHVPIIKLGAFLDGYEMAIKTLEQQPYEDCISRAKALEMLGDEPENWTDTEKEIQEVNDYRWFKSILEELPPVTPKIDVLDKIIAEIDDEAEYAYADFDEYKYDILHAEPDELPDDDFRYGLRRAIEIINKYKAESEDAE